jgi:hypothetical protein
MFMPEAVVHFCGKSLRRERACEGFRSPLIPSHARVKKSGEDGSFSPLVPASAGMSGGGNSFTRCFAGTSEGRSFDNFLKEFLASLTGLPVCGIASGINLRGAQTSD